GNATRSAVAAGFFAPKVCALGQGGASPAAPRRAPRPSGSRAPAGGGRQIRTGGWNGRRRRYSQASVSRAPAASIALPTSDDGRVSVTTSMFGPKGAVRLNAF